MPLTCHSFLPYMDPPTLSSFSLFPFWLNRPLVILCTLNRSHPLTMLPRFPHMLPFLLLLLWLLQLLFRVPSHTFSWPSPSDHGYCIPFLLAAGEQLMSSTVPLPSALWADLQHELSTEEQNCMHRQKIFKGKLSNLGVSKVHKQAHQQGKFSGNFHDSKRHLPGIMMTFY